jgi:hypothetical protein
MSRVQDGARRAHVALGIGEACPQVRQDLVVVGVCGALHRFFSVETLDLRARCIFALHQLFLLGDCRLQAIKKRGHSGVDLFDTLLTQEMFRFGAINGALRLHCGNTRLVELSLDLTLVTFSITHGLFGGGICFICGDMVHVRLFCFT